MIVNVFRINFHLLHLQPESASSSHMFPDEFKIKIQHFNVVSIQESNYLLFNYITL